MVFMRPKQTSTQTVGQLLTEGGKNCPQLTAAKNAKSSTLDRSESQTIHREDLFHIVMPSETANLKHYKQCMGIKMKFCAAISHRIFFSVSLWLLSPRHVRIVINLMYINL